MTSVTQMVAGGLVPIALAAHKHGLIDAIEGEPKTAEEHAESLGLDPRATALVLGVLEALGHCERDADGRYRRAQGFDQLAWAHLDTMLSTGEVLPMIDEPAARGPLYSRAVDHLAARFAPIADALARRLPEAEHIVDVGAGSGIWSLCMAERWAHARVVAIDLPEVLERFVAQAEQRGLADRVATVAGSYFETPPPRPADRVVLANVLHLEPAEEAAGLVARFADSLEPGGDVVIVDCFGRGTHERDLMRACYRLHLGLRTARGGVYTSDEVGAWCEQAGLSKVRVELLDEAAPGVGAVIAERA